MADGRRAGDHAPEYKHVNDMEWEMGRFKNRTKFLFNPRADRPTEPNAGLIRYEPGEFPHFGASPSGWVGSRRLS